MKIGIPKGLLYSKYHVFMKTFFQELGAEIVLSPDTNRSILNEGVTYCVDEACLPVKIFHGHVSWLRDKCDAILIPRFMSIRQKEFICPKFCGLTEMVANSIPNLPPLIGEPIYWLGSDKLYEWALKAGGHAVKDKRGIKKAFDRALEEHRHAKCGENQSGYRFRVALLGHPYNIYDPFLNMNLIRKLNQMDVGVVTEEFVDEASIDEEVGKLFKKPFWTFARNSYGAAANLAKSGKIDGIVYVSSFACGIDSVVTELIKEKTGLLPFLLLKIDEHTGEAGFYTRIEAFADMLGRRNTIADYDTPYGECLPCS